jgi:hypothetical protein
VIHTNLKLKKNFNFSFFEKIFLSKYRAQNSLKEKNYYEKNIDRKVIKKRLQGTPKKVTQKKFSKKSIKSS